MFVWILLKVYVMKQTDNARKLGIVSVSELFVKPLHYPLNGQAVVYMKRLFIIFAQEIKRVCS